jgi:hypothetical protein
MSKSPPESPFQALESEAYHAFREWPIWLALRQKQLAERTQTLRPTSPAPVGQAPRTPPPQGGRR